MNTETQLIEIQCRQLQRLLETKRVKFHVAYYVIFSDYPSAGPISAKLDSGAAIDESVREKFLDWLAVDAK